MADHSSQETQGSGPLLQERQRTPYSSGPAAVAAAGQDEPSVLPNGILLQNATDKEALAAEASERRIKLEQLEAELDREQAELAAETRRVLQDQVVRQQDEKRKQDAKRKADLKLQKEEEEQRRADRERRYKEQQALAELKKKQDVEEREKLRRERGLVTVEEAAELVHSRCALRVGVMGNLVCLRASEAYGIRGKDAHVVVVCSEKCMIRFHQSCWKDFEKAFKEQNPEWKLKRGVKCITDDCAGLITSAELYQGPPGSCTVLQVLVLYIKEEGKKEAERPAKGKKDKGFKVQKDEREQVEREPAAAIAALEPELNRPQRQDLRKRLDRHSRGYVPPEQPESSAAAIVDAAAQPKAAHKKQEEQGKGTQETDKKVAKPDVQALDFSNLRFVNKQDPETREIALSTQLPAKAKKAQKKAKERTVIQPSFTTWEDALEAQNQKQAAEGGALTRDFFTELEDWKEDDIRSNADTEEQSQAPSNTVLDVEADFPSLSEAIEAKEDPNLYIYKTSMTAMLTNLKMKHEGEFSRHLLIESIDMDYLMDLQMPPAKRLRDTLASYGNLLAFRFFPPLGKAIAQYQTEETAIEATSMLQGELLGAQKIQVCFLQLFPTDTLIEHRLQRLGVIDGDTVLPGEPTNKAPSSRSPGAIPRSIPQSAVRTGSLNIAAREYTPSFGSASSSETGERMAQARSGMGRKPPVQPPPPPPRQHAGVRGPTGRMGEALATAEPAASSSETVSRASSSELPEELAHLQETEVIGCDVSSLMEYRKAGAAFGVMPDQLVEQGWGSVPTALVMYQVDTGQLHGVWHIKGAKFVDGGEVRERVVEVHLIKVFPPLMEAQHSGLLMRSSPAPGDILYPQRLDAVKTEQLLRLLAGIKASEAHLPNGPPSAPDAAVVARTEENDQEAEYRAVAQALADEELARKLQDEMLREGEQGRQAAADEEFARKLQAEEQSVVSYKAAVKIDDYRIPRPAPPAAAARSTSSGLQAMFPDLFSDLMPHNAPAARAKDPLPAPISPARMPNQIDDSRVRQSQVGNGGVLKAQQGLPWLESATSMSSQGSLSSSSALGPSPAACRPTYKPPPAAIMATPAPAQRVNQPAPAAQTKSGIEDDLLQSLLGIPAAALQQPVVPASPQHPSVGQKASPVGLRKTTEESTSMDQSLALTRNNSGASLASAEIGETVRPEAHPRRKLPFCCLCSKNNASYIVMPCRHWGPCVVCVPSAIDLDKYQTCMQCNVRTERLMRVYTH